MRQLIEEYIVGASSQRTVSFVVDGVDNLEDLPAAPVVAAGAKPAPVRAKAGLLSIARPQDKAPKAVAGTPAQATGGKPAPLQVQRTTPKAPTLSSVDSAPASVARQSRHADRKPAVVTTP
jgi:hypothetical protein